MVFTSLPLYQDPPNWDQQIQPAIQATPIAAAGGGSAWPASMTDRARMAKIPQPETALKCPRCDSANTKFCYFNNYSLSQPRHFCKTCRRYWTRGGALRNVPVGGGCRRNKRSKSKSSSASSATAAATTAASSSSTTSTTTSSSSMMLSNFPFMASLHALSEYGSTPDLGLNFPGIQPIDHAVNYQLGGLDQWRIQQLQQFPLLGGLHSSSTAAVGAIYNPFDNDQTVANGFDGEGVVLPKATSSALITQLASVKMEDSSPQGLNLARQYMGITGNDHFFGGGWAPGDLSGFNASFSGNLL